MTRLLVLCILMALQPSASPDAGVPLTGSVSGAIADSLSSSPLRYARVRVDGTGLEAVVQPDGTFEFPAVPVGRRTITGTFVAYFPETAVVQVRAHQTSKVTLRMHRSIHSERPFTPMIWGRVVDAITGEPVSRVRVVALGLPKKGGETFTDSRGLYRLSESGSRAIVYMAAGYDTLRRTTVDACDSCCGQLKDARLEPQVPPPGDIAIEGRVEMVEVATTPEHNWVITTVTLVTAYGDTFFLLVQSGIPETCKSQVNSGTVGINYGADIRVYLEYPDMQAARRKPTVVDKVEVDCFRRR